ncbi:MAG: hypothetical protein ACUZ8H_13930 [Candidatus Anammoxibacter sp.]
MEIGDVSSNSLVLQITGMQTVKQLQPTNPNNDANITAVLEKSQNIGNNSVRTIEKSSESDTGAAVGSEEQGGNEEGAVLDLLV